MMAHDIVMGLRAAMGVMALAIVLRVLFQPSSVEATGKAPASATWRRVAWTVLMGGMAGVSITHLAMLGIPGLYHMEAVRWLIVFWLALVTAGIVMINLWFSMNSGCPKRYNIPVALVPLAFVLVAVIGGAP